MATKDDNTYWNAVKGRVSELADKASDKFLPRKMPKTAADIAPGADRLIGKGRTERIDAAVDDAVGGNTPKFKQGGLVRRGYGKARGA